MVDIDQYCVHFITGCILHWSSCGPLFVFVIKLWLLTFLNHSYPLCLHLDYVSRAQLVDCRVGSPPDIWHIYIYIVALRVQLMKWTWCRELGRNGNSEVALLKARSLGGQSVYWFTWYTHTIACRTRNRDERKRRSGYTHLKHLYIPLFSICGHTRYTFLHTARHKCVHVHTFTSNVLICCFWMILHSFNSCECEKYLDKPVPIGFFM